MTENPYYNAKKMKIMHERPWELAAPAFRVFGNLYFVGNADGASWLVDSERGLLLFDSNYPTAQTMLIDSIWSLGFNPRNIVAIFHTHGHYDHFGATAYLKNLSGATTYLSAADAKMFCERPELAMLSDAGPTYQELFVPDVEVNDNDRFEFGNTIIKAVACPGHTPGATSFIFNVTDGTQTYIACMHGGAGLNTLCRVYREEYGVDWRSDFLESINRHMSLDVDIFLGNHTKQSDTMGKYNRMTSEYNPFIDKTALRTFLEDLKKKFDDMIASEI